MFPSRSSHLPTVYLVRRERPQKSRPTNSLSSICALTSPATLTSCDLYASSVHCGNPHIVDTFQGSRCCCADVYAFWRPRIVGNQVGERNFLKWGHLDCSLGVLLFCKLLICSVSSVVIITLMVKVGRVVYGYGLCWKRFLWTGGFFKPTSKSTKAI